VGLLAQRRTAQGGAPHKAEWFCQDRESVLSPARPVETGNVRPRQNATQIVNERILTRGRDSSLAQLHRGSSRLAAGYAIEVVR